jgi:hypothetical protein
MAPPWLRVFINYRHEDTWGEALLLRDRLANRFGSENVFLDVHDVLPGMNWLEEIKSHRASCDVLLSLIGPRWMSTMKIREQAAAVQPTEDYVRFEIEYALRRDSGIYVIPVLVGDAVLFTSEALPRSLQAIAKIEVEQVRQNRFEEDLAHLFGRLETIAREQSVPAPKPTEERRAAQIPASAKGIAPPPDDAHYELILHHMVDEGNLVTFLGPRLAGGHSGPLEGSRSLPSAKEIAADLADRFGVESASLDLPGVAQYVYATKGRPDLYNAVRQILAADCEPGPVCRFLARLPRMLEELCLEKRYQLIISTNFDTELEQAFEDERNPMILPSTWRAARTRESLSTFPIRPAPSRSVPRTRTGSFRSETTESSNER